MSEDDEPSFESDAELEEIVAELEAEAKVGADADADAEAETGAGAGAGAEAEAEAYAETEKFTLAGEGDERSWLDDIDSGEDTD